MPAIPAGMIYARAPQAIWVTLTSACVSILLARAAGVTVPEVTYWFSLVGLRVVDVILAPMFVRRFNRSLAPPQRPPPLLN